VPGEFSLPLGFDLAATALFALSGALRAVKKGYDVAGLVTLSLVAGVGGGLLRDGVFLGRHPPAVLLDYRFLYAVGAAAAVGWWFGGPIEARFRPTFLVVDALGLGAYAVVGAEATLAAGLSVPAAVLVGAINAVGGGMLRDVLSREEPDVFKPGGYYALAAVAGALVFCGLVRMTPLDGVAAAVVGVATTFALRLLSVRFRWHTRPPPRARRG
jgi:uncharacterized membrane protein YeiH